MPILDSSTLEFISRSPEQTRRLGLRLGNLLQNGDVICLVGDLGSGKTTLVQGISQGWGSLNPVSSPTFVLVNQYRNPEGRTLFHLDAYRLKDAIEAEDLDLNIMIDDGALVVEWADRILPVLPPDNLTIQMRWIADEQRSLILFPRGARYVQLLGEFRQRVLGGRT
jgi:tRNA threonylcarbamoyladenosine biosynthesis protein TsaE